MKKPLVLLLVLALTGYLTVVAQPAPSGKLAEYMQAQVNANDFNGTVLVAQNGQVLYQRAFGYANYGTKAQLTLNSMFELGSVSKQFTALSILLLHEQNKLSLSDSLRKFFPELPYAGITIRHLLTHTSGLPDYEAAMVLKWDHKKVAFNSDMALFLAQEKPPILFKPGQKCDYSNTGYALLASIVEKASGQSFAQFTAQHILKPLGMSRSRIYNTRRSSTEVIPDYAYGYVYADSLGRYVLPDSLPNFQYVYYLDGILGDGTINSTVGDLLTWDRALKNHTLLPEATQKEMLTGQALINTANGRYYGYGVFIGKQDNRDYTGHSGGWPGYVTYLVRYVADDVTVIVLSNNESNSPVVSRALADIVFGKAVPLPRKKDVIQVASTLLDAYTGVYEGKFSDDPKATFTVTRTGNQLFEQLTGGKKKAIFPETETKFFFKATDARLEFIRDASGKVVKRTLMSGGQTTEATKIK